MRGEHHDRPRRRRIGNLVEILDEHCSPVPQLGNHNSVVHDLLAHIHRAFGHVKHSLDRLDSTLYTGAKRPRRRQQHRDFTRSVSLCDRSHEHLSHQHSRRHISCDNAIRSGDRTASGSAAIAAWMRSSAHRCAT